MARKKSLREIASQAGRLTAQIETQRKLNRWYGGSYGDKTDRTLHSRELRVLNALNTYTQNIHDRQGTNNELFNGDRRPVASDSQRTRQYSQSTYVSGLIVG